MAEDVTELPQMVWWLDPGKTTGWACLGLGTKFRCGQGTMEEVGEELDTAAALFLSDMSIGYEQYIVTPGGGVTGSAEPPLKTIGMIEWICYLNGCHLLKPVPSAMRKVVTVDMLKRLGWYVPGQDHAMQAARHLLAWTLREKLVTADMMDVIFG